MDPPSIEPPISDSAAKSSDGPKVRHREQQRYLVVGRIIGPVGLNGELRAQLLTDFPSRFDQLTTLHVGDNLRPHAVQSARLEGESVLLKMAGIDDADSARALRGKDISVSIDQAVELNPDQYFWHQVVGLDVLTDDGRNLGNVTEVLRTGSNDVYVVERGSRELLIPAIEDVVLNIDLSHNRMLVHLLPGIEEEGHARPDR